MKSLKLANLSDNDSKASFYPRPFLRVAAARAHQRNVCQGNECIGEKFANLDAVRLELGLSEFIYFITRGKKRNGGGGRWWDIINIQKGRSIVKYLDF